MLKIQRNNTYENRLKHENTNLKLGLKKQSWENIEFKAQIRVLKAAVIKMNKTEQNQHPNVNRANLSEAGPTSNVSFSHKYVINFEIQDIVEGLTIVNFVTCLNKTRGLRS